MKRNNYNEKVMEIEPYGVKPIPSEERHGKPKQMFSLWFAVNLALAVRPYKQLYI